MRIALGIPSGSFWNAEFGVLFAGLCGKLARQGLEYSIINIRSSSIVQNRCSIVAQAVKQKCQKILWLDTDMEFPLDVYTRLATHGERIVGCTYAQKGSPHMAQIRELGTPTAGPFREVAGIPGGCMLVDVDVYSGFEAPFYSDSWDKAHAVWITEDYGFCDRARMNGEKVWLDAPTSVLLTHLGTSRHRVDAEIVHRQSLKE